MKKLYLPSIRGRSHRKKFLAEHPISFHIKESVKKAVNESGLKKFLRISTQSCLLNPSSFG